MVFKMTLFSAFACFARDMGFATVSASAGFGTERIRQLQLQTRPEKWTGTQPTSLFMISAIIGV